MQIDDAFIIRLLVEQDPKGLELLFKYYYRPLVLWADTYLNDIPAAEDLVQEFFLSFWERKSYQQLTSGNLRGYLFAAVKNRSINALEKHDPLRDAIASLPLSLEDYEPDDLTEEMLHAIAEEIKKLPPRTREVLTAVYVEGISYRETAERFQISIATVKTLLVNALKHLRKVFAHYIFK